MTAPTQPGHETVDSVLQQLGFVDDRATFKGVQIELVQSDGRDTVPIGALAKFEPPLDLGLSVGVPTEGFESTEDLTAIDSEFAGIFTVRFAKNELENVTRLLTKPLRAALLLLARVGSVELVDALVVTHFDAMAVSAQELTHIIEALAVIANELARVRPTLTAPAVLQRSGVTDWVLALAQEHQWSVTAQPLAASGKLRDSAFSLQFYTQKPSDGAQRWGEIFAPHVRAQITFATPLSIDLAVRLATWGDRVKGFLGLDDLQMGDADFDLRWTITAQSEQAARAVLTAALRKTLDALADLGATVTLSDHRFDAILPLPKNVEPLQKLWDLTTAACDQLRPS
jgi:hypothetical protein